MEKTITPLLFLACLFILSACQPKSNKKQEETSDHHAVANTIELTGAWARPGSKAGNSAAYVQIYNGTATVDTLLSVETNIAGKAQVHESFEENGLSGMRPAGRQVIKPDSILKLQPGGFHIMMMKLNQHLAESDSVQLTFMFSNDGKHQIMVPVKFSN